MRTIFGLSFFFLCAGAAEMVAMEMKNAGIYVSRGLSFCDAEFENMERDLTKEQCAVYDQSAHVWLVSMGHIIQCSVTYRSNLDITTLDIT